jgi:hypothetical protein
MPRQLVRAALDEFAAPSGRLGIPDLAPNRRQEAVAVFAEIFDVNPVVARIRINDLHPVSGAGQLPL